MVTMADGPGTQSSPTGSRTLQELNHDLPMLQRLEHIRQEASLRMALGPAQGKNLPKVG